MRMKVPPMKGVVNPIELESCSVARKSRAEALTKESMS